MLSRQPEARRRREEEVRGTTTCISLVYARLQKSEKAPRCARTSVTSSFSIMCNSVFFPSSSSLLALSAIIQAYRAASLRTATITHRIVYATLGICILLRALIYILCVVVHRTRSLVSSSSSVNGIELRYFGIPSLESRCPLARMCVWLLRVRCALETYSFVYAVALLVAGVNLGGDIFFFSEACFECVFCMMVWFLGYTIYEYEVNI